MSDHPTPPSSTLLPPASSTVAPALPTEPTPLSTDTPAIKTTPAAPDSVGARPPAATNALTPDEQMALFEKDLKENDWGHQPC